MVIYWDNRNYSGIYDAIYSDLMKCNEILSLYMIYICVYIYMYIYIHIYIIIYIYIFNGHTKRLIPAYSIKCAMINPQKIGYGHLSIPYRKSKHRAYVMVYKPLEMDDYLPLIWENKLCFEHGKNCEMVMSLNYHRIRPTILW